MDFSKWLFISNLLESVEADRKHWGLFNQCLYGEDTDIFLEAVKPWSGVGLLTPGEMNPKTDVREKEQKYGIKLRHPQTGKSFHNAIMHLSPANESGFRCCPWHTPGCASVCLHVAGDPQRLGGKIGGRLKRTFWLAHDADGFLGRLHEEIAKMRENAERDGKHLAIRLNGTSDIPFEAPGYVVKDEKGSQIKPTVMQEFPDVIFYDYTKSFRRMMNYVSGKFPPNYHLTYSLSEMPESRTHADEILERGGNIAIVFNCFRGQRLPNVWVTRQGKGKKIRVIDGDKHDLRFLDERGVVVGLRAKGDALWDTSGFVVQPEDPHLQTPENQEWVQMATDKRAKRHKNWLSRARRHLSQGGSRKAIPGGPGAQRRLATLIHREKDKEIEKIKKAFEDYTKESGRGRNGLAAAEENEKPYKGHKEMGEDIKRLRRIPLRLLGIPDDE
jgi:hypothetical protein